MKFGELFERFDSLPSRDGYVAVIDFSSKAINHLRDFAKTAEYPEGGINWTRLLGGLAQMWRSPELQQMGIPQRPSSLGQMLVLGGLGALGGHYAGRVVDRFMPNDHIKASRAGMILGALAGAVPGGFSAVTNPYVGKGRWLDSFYDNPGYAAASGRHGIPGNVAADTINTLHNTKSILEPTPVSDIAKPALPDTSWQYKAGGFTLSNPMYSPISVRQTQDYLWNDPYASTLPEPVRAGASGLIQMAANVPGGTPGIGFVTPLDITKVAIGAGSGLFSGWLVGKTMGALFGTGQHTQDLLKNTGMAVGALRTVVPMAFGKQPFDFG